MLNIEHDVTTSKITFLSLSFRKCISKRYFRKIFFMSIRPISVQAKVQFKILQLFVVTANVVLNTWIRREWLISCV